MSEQELDRHWEDISIRPAPEPPEEDIGEIYENERGEEEGWGMARYDQTIYRAALVFGWELLFAFMVEEIVELEAGASDASNDHSQERKKISIGGIDEVKARYKALGRSLGDFPQWKRINELRLLRNALLHNGGLYTLKYLKAAGPHAPRPAPSQFDPSEISDEDLADAELIDLSSDFVVEVLDLALDSLEKLRNLPSDHGHHG